MDYLDMNKVLPLSADSSDMILQEYAVKEKVDSSSDSEAESVQSVKERKPRKKEPEVVADADQQHMINKLRKWRASFTFFESINKPISSSLKSRVGKILMDNAKKPIPITQLEEIELELQQSVSSSLDSPPTQADCVLKTVNPAIESGLTGMGYDISGFSQLANIYCKEPLVLAMIEYDILSGKKPSPLLMAAVVYLSMIQIACYNNKAKKLEAKKKSEEAAAVEVTLPDLM